MSAKKTVLEVDEPVVEADEPCGHINRHHTNEKGQLAPLACTRPRGHSGDHFATYTRLFPDPITNEKGITIKMNYTQGEAGTYWRDDAATPASEIKPDEAPQMTQYQRDLVMQLLQRNPSWNAQKAIAEAKMMKEWR